MIIRSLLFSALATPAAADPDRLSILLGSQHPGATASYEHANPGVFLTWEDRGSLGLDYSLGVYRNSFGRASVAATAAREWIDPRKLDQIRDEAKAKVIAWASAMLSQFTAGYPHEEVLSWSAKLPAARNVLHGGIEPMIQIEAKALGIDPKELAAKVAEKGGRYEAIVALAAAIRGRTHAEIDAAPDAASVDATVDKALARATETLKSLGVAI